jgi:putative ABC transport system ATP-binding protein
MTSPIIAVQNLTKQVEDSSGTLTILQDINFSLSSQQSAAIVGASGSGKSTLLSLMAGLDTPSSGTVVLDGHDLFRLSEDDRAFAPASSGLFFRAFNCCRT